MLKKCLFVLGVLLMPVAQAHVMPPKPAKCPSIAALYDGGFDVVRERDRSMDGKIRWELIKEVDNYDTNDSWTLVMLFRSAAYKEPRDAEKAAKKVLQNAGVLTGPLPFADMLWTCGTFGNLPGGMSFGISVMTPPQPVTLNAVMKKMMSESK